MRPQDFLALSQDERNRVCAEVEGWKFDRGWDGMGGCDPAWRLDIPGGRRLNKDGSAPPDFTDPRNSSRLIARAIEERPEEFGVLVMQAICDATDDPFELSVPDGWSGAMVMRVARASDDQRLACAVCALEGK